MVCYCATLCRIPYPADLLTGPIVKVSLAGQDIVVLSHPSDAEELASIHQSTNVYVY